MSFFKKTPNFRASKGDSGGEIYKILLIGDSGVGKSCLVTRFNGGYFNPNYDSCIGLVVNTMKIDFTNNQDQNKKTASLELWDISGKNVQMPQSNYINYSLVTAKVVMFVFDLTNPETLSGLTTFNKEIAEKADKQIVKILVANKYDLWEENDNKCCSKEAIEQFAEKNGFNEVFYVSAKENQAMNSITIKNVGTLDNILQSAAQHICESYPEKSIEEEWVFVPEN